MPGSCLSVSVHIRYVYVQMAVTSVEETELDFFSFP